MNLPETSTLVPRSLAAPAQRTRFNFYPSSARGSPLVRLPGYFIDQAGNVECVFRAVPEVRDDEVAEVLWGSRATDKLNELSEVEALNRLERVLSETGQLVVRTADGLTTAWFAGIGDPSNLFLELRPREAWVDRDELVMGEMCSLAEAERVLRCMYLGVGGDALSGTVGLR